MRHLGLGLLCCVMAGCGAPSGSAQPAPPDAATPSAASATTARPCDIDLANPIVIPGDRRKNQPPGPEKRAYRLGDGSIVFAGRVTVDADGAPTAYNPSNTGLDYLANGGSPGNWWALATDAQRCGKTGRPVVQGASDPAPGYYVTMTTMTNPAISNCRIQRRYVDSSTIPYVGLAPSIARISSEGRGRYAVVGRMNGTDAQPAIHADAAPASGIGEASIELTRRLGLNPSPKNGGTGSRDFIYVVMPPGEEGGFPANAAAVETAASAAFEGWGGEARMNACRRAVAAALR